MNQYLQTGMPFGFLFTSSYKEKWLDVVDIQVVLMLAWLKICVFPIGLTGVASYMAWWLWAMGSWLNCACNLGDDSNTFQKGLAQTGGSMVLWPLQRLHEKQWMQPAFFVSLVCYVLFVALTRSIRVNPVRCRNAAAFLWREIHWEAVHRSDGSEGKDQSQYTTTTSRFKDTTIINYQLYFSMSFVKTLGIILNTIKSHKTINFPHDLGKTTSQLTIFFLALGWKKQRLLYFKASQKLQLKKEPLPWPTTFQRASLDRIKGLCEAPWPGQSALCGSRFFGVMFFLKLHLNHA